MQVTTSDFPFRYTGESASFPEEASEAALRSEFPARPFFPSECYPLDNLPNDLIYEIGSYLNPKEALSLRLMNKHLALLFGNSHIWCIYYRSLGLEAPKAVPVPNETNELQISNLAKKLPFWFSLQKIIDSNIKYAGENVDLQTNIPRSLCIAALAIPQLSPLHRYATKILEKHCRVPKGLSADELILRTARGDRDFTVVEGARILALKSLSNRATEPEVQQTLLSVMTESTIDAEMFCEEAVTGLLPYLTDPQVKRAVVDALRRHGPFAVKPALNTLITTPEVLDAVIDIGYGRLEEILRDHLHSGSVVEGLVQRLSTENNLCIVGVLARALEPVSDQKLVQQALCQRLVNLRPRAQSALRHTVENAQLDSDVKEEYRNRIPIVQQQASADAILQLSIIDQRQQLLTALSSRNTFERAAAATILAPLVPNDTEVLDAFLDRINASEHSPVGIIIVSALAKVANRKDIRIFLIQKGPLDGQISFKTWSDNPSMRLATVQALRPFVNEPEVRQAFFDRLKSDGNGKVCCALIDILAPQMGKEDVQTLFLETIQAKLCWPHCLSGTEWQAAAIDKLGSIANRPKVKDALLQLFKISSQSVKAACIRALCTDKQRRLLGLDEIFVACIDRSSEVREEALRVLIDAMDS